MEPRLKRRQSDAQALLLRNLELIESLCRRIGQRKALSSDEVEEFTAWAKLRLVQDDYRILRQFRGDSSLAGFLTTSLLRMALDFLREKRGVWRPSKAAQRAGKVAVWLETLTHRDGVELEEAITQLRNNFGVSESPAQLREMAARYRRPPRRSFEGEGAIEKLEGSPAADERVEHAEVAQVADQAARGLNAAVSRLPLEDRLVVRLLFQEGFPVSKVARQLQLDQRKLYQRRDAIFRALREDLESQGIDHDQVAHLFGWGTWTDVLASDDLEIFPAGPSSKVGAGTQPGEPR